MNFIKFLNFNNKNTFIIKELIKNNNLKSKTLFAKIYKIENFYINNNEEILVESINDLTKEFYINPENKIYENYEIEFYENNLFLDMNCQLVTNKLLSKIYFIIKSGSKIINNSDIYQDFISFINTQKLKSGILINYFKTDFELELKTLIIEIQKLKINEEYIFNKDIKLLISEIPFEFIPSKEDEIIMNFKEKKTVNKDITNEINYADRDFIIEVNKDEIVFEYIKSIKGENGINCKGEIIHSFTPENKNKTKYQVGKNIYLEEYEDKIIYKSQIDGYVVEKNNLIEISNEIILNAVNFKNTGNMTTEINKNISLNVTEKDILKDSIGCGINVDVQKINVMGAVGSNSTLNSEEINIEGIVHKTSKIKTKTANINTLKGSIEAEKVHIKILDGGTVTAKEVFIEQSLGGKVIAEKIYIKKVGSNSKFFASKVIEIENMQGNFNDFTILSHLPSEKIIFENKINEIKSLEKNNTKNLILLQKNENKIKSEIMNIKKLKNYIEDLKSKNIEIPIGIKHRYNEYIKFTEEISKNKENIEFIIEKIEDLKLEIAYDKIKISNAEIINKSKVWTDNNQIIFINYNEEKIKIISDFNYFIGKIKVKLDFDEKMQIIKE